MRARHPSEVGRRCQTLRACAARAQRCSAQSARVGRVQICVHNEQLVVLRSCGSNLTSLGARHGSSQRRSGCQRHCASRRTDQIRWAARDAKHIVQRDRPAWRYVAAPALPYSAADSTVAKLDGARTKVVNSAESLHMWPDAPESTIQVWRLAVCALCCCDQGRTRSVDRPSCSRASAASSGTACGSLAAVLAE
jgi:hypothetical protein